MTDFNVRQAATQVQRAAFNADMLRLMVVEVLVAAVAAGIYFKSLAWGLGVFFGGIVLFNLPGLQAWIAEAFNIGWGVVAFVVVRRIDPTETAAPFMAAGIAYLVATGCHRLLFQWQRDFR